MAESGRSVRAKPYKYGPFQRRTGFDEVALSDLISPLKKHMLSKVEIRKTLRWPSIVQY